LSRKEGGAVVRYGHDAAEASSAAVPPYPNCLIPPPRKLRAIGIRTVMASLADYKGVSWADERIGHVYFSQ
jgi:hypothetical protein